MMLDLASLRISLTRYESEAKLKTFSNHYNHLAGHSAACLRTPKEIVI